ncbi:MAG TPA: serine/threonine-protein kinase, partial [Vicinamibacterales bacterium]|nr:serine/threonine-protein kinase [Vicinamibacterales bacterium]
MQCQSCGTVMPAEGRFCLTCGQPMGTPSEQATIAAAHGVVAVAGPDVRRLASSDTVPVGGFTPGVILADRYRIIGLLGRGGMGEVYRADDLKLGQPVALKFLPRALADDPVRRERFFAEVRITRQLSHPNICRVYDIAEVNGQHFLSMEYIDGEDLASLLKRIGYLANEKALDITRQLVAGVAAAHERGVLHRDLKPANVMLDGRGRVRITDFGLAVAATDEAQASEMSGTPAYMAPEQLAGKGATVRSDIYALGLVLYELYTGRRAFSAPTLAELREQKES